MLPIGASCMAPATSILNTSRGQRGGRSLGACATACAPVLPSHADSCTLWTTCRCVSGWGRGVRHRATSAARFAS
eukprot:14383387-Alexandrium_andersonii.AAC.1